MTGSTSQIVRHRNCHVLRPPHRTFMAFFFPRQNHDMGPHHMGAWIHPTGFKGFEVAALKGEVDQVSLVLERNLLSTIRLRSNFP